ncbi:hypothetical protein A8C32_10390 [Flavivirga aquatica]|uniref:Immunoglobulin domain-containing protein n=1 Tax=Flavivirga aquatica TaxID=1849968 RepID=A0A1E5TCN7_9FLAO|nr:hypothetical protein A8C32_10390 [Flavivirga aquatica]
MPQEERQALIDLYNATKGDKWNNTIEGDKPWLINETSSLVSDWYGVTVVDGKVIEVNLNNNILEGEIQSSINNLLHLTVLNLGDNQLSGSIPSSIGGLHMLITLILENNKLTEELPVALGSLANLVTLKLGGNNLKKEIPISFCNLLNLQELDLSNNQITGKLIPEFAFLKSLVRLDVRNNQLEGMIPQGLQTLSNLEFVGLSDNSFKGKLPLGFRSLSNLQELLFENNQFIFSDFEDLHKDFKAKLTNYVYVPQANVDEIESKSVTVRSSIILSTKLSSDNNTYVWYKDGERIPSTGNEIVINEAEVEDAGEYYFGAINSTIENLELIRNKITLIVKENCSVPSSQRQALFDLFNATGGKNWINYKDGNQAWDISNPDSKVCDWYGVTVEDEKITGLNLSGNNLEGMLPDTLGDLVNLETLNVSNNKIIGDVPTSISQIPVLATLNIENNQLVFRNIETDFTTYTNLTNFTYTPQDLVDVEEVMVVEPTKSITLKNNVLTSENNRYQWLKNGLPIDGANDEEYIITNANAAKDAGMYSFVATNTIVDNLEIKRRIIKVEVKDSSSVDCKVSLEEKQALIDLYIATGGPEWTNNTNWLTDKPVCEWFGVHVENNQIKELSLVNNNLVGSIPKQIENLKYVTILSLVFNKDLIGPIPPELEKLQFLNELNLSNNALTGSIPSFTSSSISTLFFHNNKLSGTIPDLTGLENLEELEIQENAFIFKDLENKLSGYPDGVFLYTPQDKVDKEETRIVRIEGSIVLTSSVLMSDNNRYQWYKKVNDVYEIIVGATNKDYTINNVVAEDAGEYIFKATNETIDNLELERNPITLQIVAADACDVSETEREALVKLYQATDGANWTNTKANNQPWLINDPDSKVCDWYGVTVGSEVIVTEVSLSNNNLRGEIPDQLEQLINLTTLNLEENLLTGAYPLAVNELIALEVLNLSKNTYVGEISENIGALINLKTLDLGDNRFAGAIPNSIGNLTDLVNLDLSANKLQETIPSNLWSLYNLKTIKLQENRLTGGISSDIGNLPLLEVFWCSNNNFSGAIPQTIRLDNTPNLYSIHLDHNYFSGDLPQLIPNLSLPNTSVQINNNAFIFNDFELEFPAYKTQLDNFTYIPQDFVDQNEIRYIELGEPTILTSMELVSDNNEYKWYKSSPGGIFEIIPDATSKDYTLTITDAVDFGSQYRFIATNTVVDSLKLTRRTITILEYKDTDGDGTPDHIDKDDDDDGCLDILEIENGSDPLDPNDNNCPTDPDGEVSNPEDYTFCESLATISIGNLAVPNGGRVALWFDNEADTTPIPEEEELFKSQILWAEVDGVPQKVAVPLKINEGAPGIFETVNEDGVIIDESFQAFPTKAHATIGDLKITPSVGITWYASPTSTTVLSNDMLLEDGKSYYASLNGHPCRFEVEVFIGIKDVFADGIQYFCASNSPTLQSVDVVKTYLDGEIRWYNAETGGGALPETTVLVNGTTYYVTEFYEGDESELRMPVEVVVYDIQFSEYLKKDQYIFAKDGVIPTIANLIAQDDTIKWYAAPEGGTPYAPTTSLISGHTYYAAQVNSKETCESDTRLAVRVYVKNEEPPILVGCEKFKPQPGDRYVVSGWVREQGISEDFRETRNFIADKPSSDRLLELLNHLVKDFVLNEEPRKAIRFVEENYIPDIENKVYDAILPYVIDGPTDNLAIYNFKYVTEGRSEYGYKRTIGFQFSFSPEAKGDDFDFKYVTPAYEGGVNPQRYPIFNNPSLKIEFTGFVANGNTLEVVSKFSIDTKAGDGLLNNNKPDYKTVFNNIALTHDFITYKSDPDYQVQNYMNSLIEVVYENEEGEVLDLDTQYKVAFKPKGAIIDGWQRISTDFFVPSEAAFMNIVLKNTSGEDINSYFDDIRMHPFKSNIKTFVYDPKTQRLQSELDENNYATFYEYDKEGGLVRVKKETERGIYTIQETRSNNSK